MLMGEQPFHCDDAVVNRRYPKRDRRDCASIQICSTYLDWTRDDMHLFGHVTSRFVSCFSCSVPTPVDIRNVTATGLPQVQAAGLRVRHITAGGD